VAIIIAIAVVLSIFSYENSTATSSRVLDLASNEARSSAEIQAHTLSAVLANKIESVDDNVKIIAGANSIRDESVEGAKPLFAHAQESTSDITSGYSWLDKDGKVLWAASFSDPATYEQFAGSDFSHRDYFSKPKETLTPHYSTVFEAVDGIPRLTISYPILVDTGGGQVFQGVIAGGMQVDTLGRYLQGQLTPELNSNIGLLDRSGSVLYSSSSPQNVGKKIFDPEIQSAIPESIKDSFYVFLQDSFNGNKGSADFSSDGRKGTIAYEPVIINGNDFAILYVVAPHELAGTAVALIEQQRTIGIVTIALIGAVAAGISIVVLVWNGRLSRLVRSKTAELGVANQNLAESNTQLQILNRKLIETNEQLAASNEQLKVHDKLQREFVNIAAHELRTPVQPLLGAAEMIENGFGDKDKVEISRPEVEMILRNAKRLERLSSDILAISRIESGSLELYKETFSLSHIIALSVKDAKSQIGFDPEKLKITYYPDDIFVSADREKITQVVMNILVNAIKFTEHGTISIETRKDSANKFAQVTIKDSGSGIHPEVLPRLFEKFVTRSQKGTGIGLFISKKIIEAHGGTIVGGNNADGIGAFFSFTVPLAHEVKEPMHSSLPTSDRG
jgi:signal transduction histidine kinase